MLTAVVAESVSQIVTHGIDRGTLRLRVVLEPLRRVVERPAVALGSTGAKRPFPVVRDVLVEALLVWEALTFGERVVLLRNRLVN